MGHGTRAGPRQAQVDRSDTELIRKVQKAKLVLDIRITNRWALDPVAEGLVVNADGM